MKVRGLFEGRQWIASIKQGRKLLRTCARNRARDWLKSLRMYRAAKQKATRQESNMADFCQQCSLEMFDRDFRELAELGPKGSVLPPEHGWMALCEGCGPTLVDQDGKCIAAYCPEHGSKAK